MSNQLQITGGAKVRNLEGVLTGTSGVVSSLGINVPSGIPQLDGSGKILVSQLPNSVMEYKGTWNAATNTPTLANGTGNQGDVYLCNIAGTVNFGAGAITFAVGDQVIYSGTIWQKASGSTGTVTSVAITESGDALTITGSPITTSGTINIGFAGTSGQYINGAGGLTTFPSFVSSVGLTTTSPALTITNSPITSSGNIELNFAGTGLQYIKGDGTLATFPTTIDQAKRLITEVYNSTGATLTKGTVVYINGGQGNLPTVTKAQANNDANSAQTYGVVQSDITNNNNGFVVVIGSLADLDTQAYAVGTQLYLSGTTAGAWTSTKPSAPIHLVYVAIVVRSHPTQGVVEVRIQNGYELEELHDVAISAPVNNQGIFYNSSNDLWENKSIATALGYTPADDSLVVKLAGTQTITGAKTFNSSITSANIAYFNNGILLKDGGLSSATGHFGITAPNSTTVKFNSSSGNTADFVMPTGTRTFTLPNATGTIALTSDLGNYVTLDTTQTITGAKTFSNNVRIDNGSASAFLGFKQYSSGSTGTAGFTSIYAISTDTFGISYGAGNDILFKTASPTLPRTYTFPDASGTVALTSNLSGYVQGSGTTNYIPKFTASGTIGNSSIIDNGTITAYTNAFYVYQTAGTGAAFYMTGGGTDATISSVTSGGANQNLNLMGSTLSLWTGTLGGLAYTERMRITPTGNVGINTTTTPVRFTIANADTRIEFDQLNSTTSYLEAINTARSTSNFFSMYTRGLNIWTRPSGTGTYAQTMTITDAGNVGIGTSSPALNLHIFTSGTSFTNTTVTYSSATSRGILLDNSAGTSQSGNAIWFANSGLYSAIASTRVNTGNWGTDLRFYTHPDTTTNQFDVTERMRITSGGDVGIGNANAVEHRLLVAGRDASSSYYALVVTNNSLSSLLYIRNDGYAWISQNAWAYGSDRRLKENINYIESGLDKILALKPAKFDYIDGIKNNIGWIAQDVEEVIPEAVLVNTNDEREYLSLKSDFIIPYLVKAVQELSAKVSALENKS